VDTRSVAAEAAKKVPMIQTNTILQTSLQVAIAKKADFFDPP